MTPAETAGLVKFTSILVAFALLGLLAALAVVVEFRRDAGARRTDPASGFTMAVAVVIVVCVLIMLDNPGVGTP